MAFERKLYKLYNLIGSKLGLVEKPVDIATFGTTDERLAEMAVAASSGSDDMMRLFFAHEGRPVHKWMHYLPIYDRWFSRARGTPVKFLEIGVLDGGSLDFWRRYFGPEATIVGIDNNPACADRVTPPNIVRIGSQADPQFLEQLAKELGPFDFILDDGSHVGWHQSASFNALFAHVKVGGLYIIEDTHTSYFANHDGGYRRHSSAIELGKTLVDDLHGWYHRHETRPWAKSEIPAVHFYDSMIVVEKDRHPRPQMLRGGGVPPGWVNPIRPSGR
ncbi:MAG: class I SAM-dependent methyltransferase [Proteobacteria bacterium]|nr:MAG: class I SAM-dependent methyltransferase [Pseudomonadota bacterium]